MPSSKVDGGAAAADGRAGTLLTLLGVKGGYCTRRTLYKAVCGTQLWPGYTGIFFATRLGDLTAKSSRVSFRIE